MSYFYAVSDKKLIEQPSLKLASANASQEEINGVKDDGRDVVEKSLNLGKSSLGSGTTASERSIIVLGQGSPKVW